MAINVLVLEDNQMEQTWFNLLLKKIGKSTPSDVNANFVDSVDDAMAEMNRMPYDLIIADIQVIGEKTGLDLWQYAQNQNIDAQFMLVSGTQAKVVHDFFTGAEVKWPIFVHKPLDPKLMQKLIAKQLNLPSQEEIM